MEWDVSGRDQTHSFQEAEQLCSMVFFFVILTQEFLTFLIKSVGNFSAYGFSQTSRFFSCHFIVAIASLSVQMIPVISTEETYRKCTISEEDWHCIFRHC